MTEFKKWQTVKADTYSKDTPLCLTELPKLRFIQGGNEAKAEVFLKCGCKEEPFKYKSLAMHRKSVGHVNFIAQTTTSVSTTPVVNNNAYKRPAWISTDDLHEVIKDVKKLPDTAYNKAKLIRLQHIVDNDLWLCRCGSTYTKRNKKHMETSLHKTWHEHGRPNKVCIRVPGFAPLH